MKDIHFFIVCPEKPSTDFINASKELSNLHFIQGVLPELVPSYIMHSDIIIIPNPTNMYKSFPWGITAKYYQAMYAKKRVVVYSDNIELKKYGFFITYTYDEFVNEIRDNIGKGDFNYDFDFSQINWDVLSKRMINIIERL